MIPGLGGGLSASVGGGGPSSASGQTAFDTSWNINFGSGSLSAARTEGTGAPLDAYLPYAVLAVGLLVAWRMTRK